MDDHRSSKIIRRAGQLHSINRELNVFRNVPIWVFIATLKYLQRRPIMAQEKVLRDPRNDPNNLKKNRKKVEMWSAMNTNFIDLWYTKDL